MREKHEAAERVVISLSHGEYEALLDLVEIGDWVLHSSETDPPPETAAHRGVEQMILSFARAAGCGRLVDYDPKLREHFPTRALDERTMEVMDEYDEDTFWDELVSRLAERDLVRRLGEEAVRKMDAKERDRHLDRLEDSYWSEFERHGVDHLQVLRLGGAS